MPPQGIELEPSLMLALYQCLDNFLLVTAQLIVELHPDTAIGHPYDLAGNLEMA